MASWDQLARVACVFKTRSIFLITVFFFSILLVHANIVFLIIFSGTRMLRVVVKKKKKKLYWFMPTHFHTFQLSTKKKYYT